MNHRFLFLLLLSALSCSLHAQTMKQWMVQGEQSMELGDYLQAELCFAEAYALDSSNFNATIRYADALRLSRNYPEAARLYAKAYDKDKGRLYPEGLYYLAQMQVLNEDYSEALKNFKKHERRLKRDKSSFAYLKIQQEMASCDFALNARMQDSDIELRPLDNVNTFDSELSPFRLDSALFFTASGQKSNDLRLFQSLREDSTFAAPSLLDGPWSDALQHGNLVFSPDASRAYYVRCGNGLCHLYECTVVDGRFMDDRLIPTLNREEVNSTMPFIGTYQGEEYLFFASDWPGSRGGLDLYWSLRKADGSWDAPVNAGDNVNTPGNELSPYFSGEHLYFSSDWHPGFGGFDVFRCAGYPRSFDLPENLGRPLNSSLNDLYYRYFPSEQKGYLASNREGSLSDGSFCCSDLYEVSIADSIPSEEPEVYASLQELNDYLPVTLYFHNDEPNPRTRDTTTNLSYEDAYRSYLKLQNTYRKELGKGLSGDEKEDASFEVDTFYDYYIKKGFKDLEQFADLLFEELEAGHSIRLIIKGFASPRAKSDYNVKLTQRRIYSLINYLRRDEQGRFVPYIDRNAANHATLDFEALPFGEYRADQNVSDQLDDQLQSIYAREARLERKIEIQSARIGSQDSLFGDLLAEKAVKEFGLIAPDKLLSHRFLLKSVGTDTLYIDSIQSSCGCTVPTLLERILAPGSEAELEVVFDPSGQRGFVSRRVLLFLRGREEPYELTLQAEIIEGGR